MGKIYSSKTHLSGFDSKDYNKEKMDRYWKMQNNLQYDSILDDEDLHIQIKDLKLTLEKKIVGLIKKGYSIPTISKSEK